MTTMLNNWYSLDIVAKQLSVDVTLTHTNLLNIVAEQVQPFMAMVFPNGNKQ